MEEKMMNDFDQLEQERKDLLRWISERNRHVPVSELAFMLGVCEEDREEEQGPDAFSAF